MTKQEFIQRAVLAAYPNPNKSQDQLWQDALLLWEAQPKNETKKTTRFVKPTPSEVDAYIKEKGYHGFDGNKFCNHYESKGWKIGSTPMKSWKAAVSTWSTRVEAKKNNYQLLTK